MAAFQAILDYEPDGSGVAFNEVEVPPGTSRLTLKTAPTLIPSSLSRPAASPPIRRSLTCEMTPGTLAGSIEAATSATSAAPLLRCQMSTKPVISGSPPG